MADRIDFDSLVLRDASDGKLRKAIERRKSHLKTLRSQLGQTRYGRQALIQLLAEAVVIHKIWHNILNKYVLDNQAVPGTVRARSFLRNSRSSLMYQYDDSFEPYFDNESGFMDMDLARLRTLANMSSFRDEQAVEQLEFFFCHYSTVIGMCYGYNELILSGVDFNESKMRIADPPSPPPTHPATITSYTDYFASALMNPEIDGVGRFTRLYM